MRIGIIGDYNPAFHSHAATNVALQRAAEHFGVTLHAPWLPTPTLLDPDYEERLARYDGLFATPGSPYQSFDGMLRGIQFARERNWPFVGT
jgi:CTP synthase (UTP-ammonia lyase)